jgi:hypothetical protein
LIDNDFCQRQTLTLGKLALNRNALPSVNFWTVLDACVEVKTTDGQVLVASPVRLAIFCAIWDFLTKWEMPSNPQLEVRVRTILQLWVTLTDQNLELSNKCE